MVTLDILCDTVVFNPRLHSYVVCSLTTYRCIHEYPVDVIQTSDTLVKIYKYDLVNPNNDILSNEYITCSVAMLQVDKDKYSIAGVSLRGSLRGVRDGCTKDIMLHSLLHKDLFTCIQDEDNVTLVKKSQVVTPGPERVSLDKTDNGYELSIIYKVIDL